MLIHNLFPIPIASIKVPKYFSKYIPHLENFPHITSPDGNPSYGTRSVNSYILETPPLKEFKTYIINKVSNYAFNILNLSKEDYKFTQSWISFKPPQHYHQHHTHPNSIISGVFFWENISNNTPNIIFHKSNYIPNTWEITPDIPTSNPNNIQNPQFTSSYSLPASPGTLLLFPSYLPHSVSMNNTDEVRKSLAFNSIPKKGFGNESNLTELKFN